MENMNGTTNLTETFTNELAQSLNQALNQNFEHELQNGLNITFFKQLLESELNWKYTTGEQAQLDNELTGDDVDKYNAEKDKVLDFRLRGRTNLYLKKVRDALARIEQGEFGLCQDCGAHISEKRLLARPTATMCIGCKEEQERGENATFSKQRNSAKVSKSDGILKFKNVGTAAKAIKEDFIETA